MSGVVTVVVVLIVTMTVMLLLWRFTGPRGPRDDATAPEDPTTGEDPRYLTPASAEEQEDVGADAEYGPGVPEHGW